ncbi:ribonuclease HIII [Culicoidibacter larvae]|uniref:ribonuclease HIII n=1 Tax=Culicoidibacter larvae TaxID=2579976 RepID=UPI001485BDB7|nr:ribonuclease HIII [Culicoidibacter larvae]
MPITLLATNEVIEKMHFFYSEQIDAKTPPYAVFRARTDNCVITAYESLKVVFQGAGETQEAKLWQGFLPESASSTAKPVPAKSDGHSAGKYRHLQAIGSDESGVGDYFGPLTAAAAYIGHEQQAIVAQYRLLDSKQLTDDYIRSIAPNLMQEIPYKIAIMPNEKYNLYQAQGVNANKMKAILHNHALSDLKGRITAPVDLILVDQFVNERKYYEYLAGMQPLTGLTFETKAENMHPAVAAASILARYTYLQAMDKLSAEVGVQLLKGANAKVDEQIRMLVAQNGKEILNHIAKVHFVNTEKALGEN